jgi:hypothetical protein
MESWGFTSSTQQSQVIYVFTDPLHLISLLKTNESDKIMGVPLPGPRGMRSLCIFKELFTHILN